MMRKERELKRAVRNGYAQIAKKAGSCCSSQSPCCEAGSLDEMSRKVGYSEEQLLSAPAESNLGLGCGNPVALASIREGEVVLDLGSGAGLDCFLASRAVGPSGEVIGVDMTSEMVERAKANARQGGYRNVDFRQGELENLPVADGFVDLVISNCVINLVPNKLRVFAEAFRVLKPGGRLMVSDIVLGRELPEFVRNSTGAYISCLAGAVLKADYLSAIRDAGFEQVQVLDESEFPVDCLLSSSAGQAIEMTALSPAQIAEVKGAVSSVKVSAVKPASG
ncbi:MAG TPA: arsenite methyltransferase [Methanotrichaceae archaeon]|nr:arsenite methyltransferase [Methanotrichaceae archaeon]HQF17112.1 arsenite methyltransferase [Methanotrichaceae archaeon]HQI91733.1 arsenite methyltransferase [Methanotrichaceae archaeon]HQJ28956.1 arsenite methyltransferase [Methanotrichaceae archaeon]